MVVGHVLNGSILGQALEEEGSGQVDLFSDAKCVTVEKSCRVGIGHDRGWVARGDVTKKLTGAKGIVDSAIKGIAWRRSGV
jgi:hypothetical protein